MNCKKLGFGLMRLPQNSGGIDIEQFKVMVDMFLEAGCTYFDTAWIYGGSEDATRQALVERHDRGSFTLASKLAPWAKCETRADAVAQFETSLRRSGAGFFDYYLLHNLGEDRTALFDNFGLWDFVQEQKAAGKIRHVGFSFHSTADDLESILQKHPEMEFVQLQINYADWDDPKIQSRKCYEVARKYGKPVIVMEPVKGGMLASPPEPVADLFKQAAPECSYASWAIRFAASLDGVMTVLSGMSNIEQMQDNLSYMKDFKPLSENELETVHQAQKALAAIPVIPCTGCNYCIKVCPENIGIPGTFSALNLYNTYADLKTAKQREHWNIDGQKLSHADKCIKCGKCEQACPQHIKIRQHLAEAVEKLEIKSETV